jgi:hypothetical protein
VDKAANQFQTLWKKVSPYNKSNIQTIVLRINGYAYNSQFFDNELKIFSMFEDLEDKTEPRLDPT